jgi:hypothetical protein
MKSGAKVWIKRLTGLSIILILVFVATYGDSTDKIIEKMNVEENNLLELKGGTEGYVELEAIGLYTIVTLENNELLENEIKLIDQEGNEVDGIVPNSLEKMNKRPDSNGKLVYVPVMIFDVPKNAEYQLLNEGNNTLWILDDLEIQSSLISDTTILVSMLSCCLGFPLGIIALIGSLFVWRRKNKPQQKLLVEEEIMTTDQLFKQYNPTVKDDVPAPFVDLEGEANRDLLNHDLSNIVQVAEEISDNSPDEGNNNENQMDEKWKNWDDGD